MRKVLTMETMLGKIVLKLVALSGEVLGAVFDLLEKLGGSNGGEWLAMLKRFLRKEACWTKETVEAVAKITKSVLVFIATTTVSIPVGRFVARDHFKVDTSKRAKAKVSWLSDNFQNWFLDKSEEQAGGDSTLRSHKLIAASIDAPIIAELGGEAMAETSLVEMFAMMAKQGQGENGSLLTSGYWNIFYIRDTAGVLRAVGVDWFGDGWRVRAFSVADSFECFAGSRVVSR